MRKIIGTILLVVGGALTGYGVTKMLKDNKEET